jgi:hypothetical protein
LLGSIGISLVLVALGSLGFRRSMPAGLDALKAWSAPPSLLVDEEGAPIATFSLVEAVEDGPPPPTLLAEAFLAAAPPSFYEPRVDGATTLPGALLRLLRGEPSSASPLSLALARALLQGEAPGARRQGREELLATSLESATTVTARVEAWLDWVPLCRGRRGLQRARRECLGSEGGGWNDAEMATLAAAAAWGIDLAGERRLLAARRDAVLEQLVRRGLVDLDGARSGGLPPLVSPPTSEDCLPQLLADARAVWTGPLTEPQRLETAIHGGARELLVRHGATSALLIDVRDGTVRGCRQGGDSVDVEAFEALAVAGGGSAPTLRWLPGSEDDGDRQSSPRLSAWQSLLSMNDVRGLRWALDGDVLTLAHPTVAGAVRFGSPQEAESFVEALARLLPRARALLPDDLEVITNRGGLRVQRRAG